jgi:hypothetical protein
MVSEDASRQADFLVLHSIEGRPYNMIKVVDLFQQMFLADDCRIEWAGGKGGKLVRCSKAVLGKIISDASDSSIELFGGENIFGYDGPRDGWRLMSAFFPKKNLILVGRAASAAGEGLDVEWVHGTVAKLEAIVNVQYGYAYSSSIPHGVGYAIGVFCADKYHDILDFDESDRIGNWARACDNSTDGPYLRDLFQINIFSKSKLNATNILEFAQTSWTKMSLGDLILVEIPPAARSHSYSMLVERNLIISAHQSGCYSQE